MDAVLPMNASADLLSLVSMYMSIPRTFVFCIFLTHSFAFLQRKPVSWSLRSSNCRLDHVVCLGPSDQPSTRRSSAAKGPQTQQYRPIPVMPSQLFQQLALSQLELLATSLTEPSNEDDNASSKVSKIKSMALYLPQENPTTGALEFSPAVRYPHPSSERVFIANEAESGIKPKLPRTLTTLPGFQHATSLIPGYPLLSSSTEAGVGVVEEVMCDIRSAGGGAALSVPLISGVRTVGVLLVSPNDQTPRSQHSAGSVWSQQDREQVARAAKSLSLALSMDTERNALELQNRQVEEALSDSLHQVKNPLQALRTFGKLLQQRIADSEQEGSSTTAGMTPQLLELAEHLMVQSERLADRLKPVDGIVETLAANRNNNRPLALQSAKDEAGALVPFQIPLLPTKEGDSSAKKGEEAVYYSGPRRRVSKSAKPQNADDSSPLHFTNFVHSDDEAPFFASESHSSDVQQPTSTPSSSPSPLSSGPMELEIAFIDDVLEGILPGFRAIAADHDLAFDVVVSDELPGVKINTEALQEAVTNVLDNAFRYVQLADRMLPRVRLRVLPNEEPVAPGVTILVEDNGLGIPLEERETVFQRGVRGQDVEDRVKGSGIGLDIARSLVEQMGGRLQVVDNQKYERALSGTVMELILYRNPKISN